MSWYAGGTQVRTRAVDLNSGGRAEWNEQLVLDLAAPSGEPIQALAAFLGTLTAPSSAIALFSVLHTKLCGQSFAYLHSQQPCMIPCRIATLICAFIVG